MIEHTAVDGVNDVVRPNLPVSSRPHRVVIPRRAFQPGASARKRREKKLALSRYQKAVQVRRVDGAIRRPLLHRRWIFRHRKFKEPWLVPYFDRLDEGSGGKHAMSHRSDAMSFNLRADGIGDAELE